MSLPLELELEIMLHIYLLRHGQTDYNLKGIVQGAGVDASLNRKGLIQARQFFEAYRHTKFDGMYCSTQQRSFQTLLPWMEIGYEVKQFEGLREFSWGNLEGVKPNPAQRKTYLDLVASWSQGKIDRKVEEGESPIEAWGRVKPALDEIQGLHQEGKILICSHGRTMRVILSMLVGKGLSDMEPYKSGNTGLSILHVPTAGSYIPVEINNTDHLVADD